MAERAIFTNGHARLNTSVERFLRPERIAGDQIEGFVWHSEFGHEVPIRVALPRGMTEADAMAGAAGGFLVLDRSGRRLTRSWG